jgi:hypothetical protein
VSWERRAWAALVAALLLITVARVMLVESLPDQGYFAKYTTFADRILAGQMPRDRLADLSPGYLWLVVALRRLGLDFRAIRALQIAMVSLAGLSCAVAARRFGWIAIVASAAFVIGSRGALVCATEVEPETVILLLNALVILTLSASEGEGSVWAGGALLGLSAICRPVALLVAGALRSWRILVAVLVPVVAMVLVNIAITGEAVLMDPGTVFYEGMNPSAAGYEGVQPRIVNDLERTNREPDFLHVAYRLVASISEQRTLTRAESNRFWTAKALAFARTYPAAALRLTLRKCWFALHSYEAYDLVTMARKDRLLARLPVFVPFGVLVALAFAAIALMSCRALARELGERAAHDGRVVDASALPAASLTLGVTKTAVTFALAGGVAMIVFYVTARQRNAIVPAMAVLAAIGLTEIVKRRHVVAAIAVVVIAIALSIDSRWQRDDRDGWFAPPSDFDRARDLESQNRWQDADTVLIRLPRAPHGENRSVPSLAFYRARAAAHLGRDPRPLLDEAEREAPGNEHVLAMKAKLGDAGAKARLFALHDRLTAERALGGD